MSMRTAIISVCVYVVAICRHHAGALGLVSSTCSPGTMHAVNTAGEHRKVVSFVRSRTAMQSTISIHFTGLSSLEGCVLST